MRKSSSPLQSKKFIAYLIAEITWKLLLFKTIFEFSSKKIEHYEFTIIITMVVTSGFIQIGYIIGQAALDKYTFLATSAISKDESVEKGKEDAKDTKV